jgi:subtilisin family serine protease
VAEACVPLGGALSIEGRNLSDLARAALALDVDGRTVSLQVLSRTPSQLLVQLPTQGIEPGERYRVLLMRDGRAGRFATIGLQVTVCRGATGGTAGESAGNATGESAGNAAGNAAGESAAGSGPQEVLVLAEGDQESLILAELQNRNATVLRNNALAALGVILIVFASEDPQADIAELRATFPQADIDFNTDMGAAQSSGGAPRLYAKKTLNWSEAENCLDRAARIPIGLIDGAVSLSHPAFDGQTVISEDFLDGADPDQQHATAIASIIIGASPDLGFGGLLPGTRLMSAIVLRRTGDNELLASTESTVRGLDWLVGEGVRLTNVSLAIDRPNRVLVRGFEKAIERGMLVFAAAGNAGPDAPPSYPASIEGVFAVTAVDARGRIFRDSNHGDFIDFAAPGVDIWSASVGGGGSYRTGTSYAVPYAVSVAALFLGLNASLSSSVFEGIISSSVEDLGPAGPDRVFGAGLLRAFPCP